MELFVIRNNKQREKLIEIIENYRLPFKGVLQDIFPNRSISANSYYWGVLLKILSEETGHTPEELHKHYKRILLLQYRPDKTGKWNLRVLSTTELNQEEFMEYCLKVRAQAMVDLRINLPLPNEVIINE